MKNKHLKPQGNVGEAKAILHYTERGFIVSKPLFENSPYDLIVDNGESVQRVQVKTCEHKQPNGRYEVNLRVFGGNRSGTGKVKKFDAGKVDLVFAVVGDGRIFELDAKPLDGKGRVVVG
jgi:hypothetical protein